MANVRRRLFPWFLTLLPGFACQARPSSVPLGGTPAASSQAPASDSRDNTANDTPARQSPVQARPEPTPPPPREAPAGEPRAAAQPAKESAPAPPAPECNTGDAEPGDCMALQPPVELCAEGQLVRRYCEVANRLLQPRVARKYYECIRDYSGSEALCSAKLQPDCFVKATTVTCGAPPLAQKCELLLRDCPSLPRFLRQNCERALSAVKSDKLEEFSRCLSRCDVPACLALDTAP